MSAILVPVDFSIPAHNAYHYALHLAQELNLDIVLAHYYGPGINTQEPLIVKEDGNIGVDFAERLRAFAHPEGYGIDYPLVEPPTGVTIYYESDVALANSATIINRANQSDIMLVVMATRSTKRFMGNWLGSTSTTVSEACARPVFLIPENTGFTSFKEVVIANNQPIKDPTPFWEMEGLSKIFSGRLHFVRVGNPGKDQSPDLVPWQTMNKFAADRSADQSSYSYKVATVDADDISKGLLHYADKVDANLIVVINQRRSRWRSLFRNSLSQDVALRSERPVLVLHAENFGAKA